MRPLVALLLLVAAVAGAAPPPDWTNQVQASWLGRNVTSGTSNGGKCSPGTACNLDMVGAPVDLTTGLPRGMTHAMRINDDPYPSAAHLKKSGPSTQLSWTGPITFFGWLRMRNAPTLPSATAHPWGNSHAAAKGVRFEWQAFDFGHLTSRFGANSVSDFEAYLNGPQTGNWFFLWQKWQSGTPCGIGSAGSFSVTPAMNQKVSPAVVCVPGVHGCYLPEGPCFPDQQAEGVGVFQIGGEPGSGDIDYGEVGIDTDAMTDASLCRICSCGLQGNTGLDAGSNPCDCSGSTWVATGRNATECGSCSLAGLACNAAAPVYDSGVVATTTTTLAPGATTTTTTPPSGATFVIDAATGSDSASGSAAAPWKTWGKFVRSMNTGVITAGATVKFRPGRYYACEGLSYTNEPFANGGGTAGNPITVTIDTSVPGNVEITGGARPGVCGIPAWQPASKCTSGPHLDAACDTNAECGGGTCSPMGGVWWTRATLDSDSTWWGGIMAGAAYQPSTTPGGAPKIYERLYAPNNAQVKFPTFTNGRAQMMPYPMMPSGAVNGLPIGCTADKVPWLCCTGAGTGTCGTGTYSGGRIYVQTETGASPSTIADASFGQVEFPHSLQVINNSINTGSPLQYITFTNNNNGRVFHFRWGMTGIMLLRHTQGLTFEDFDAGYTSRQGAYTQLVFGAHGNRNGSAFPPANGGDSYMITGWQDDGANVVRDIAFRRGKVHGNFGNEAIHFIGGPPDRFTNIIWDSLEVGDTTFAVPNNGVGVLSGGTALTPNAYTNQVQKFWPPPGYSQYATVYGTHWGPLGGGGASDGHFITTSTNQTIRNCYFHDGGLMSFFESGGSGDLIFENNLVDLNRQYYAGGPMWPHTLISNCDGTPANGCNGAYDGRVAMTISNMFRYPNRKGTIFRNNVIKNGYNGIIRTGLFGNNDAPPTFKPITPGMIVNNTFHIKGDAREANGANGQVPLIWFWAGLVDAQNPQGTVPNINTVNGEKFLFKNNIILRDTASVAVPPIPLVEVDPVLADEIDMDYNNWGGINGVWKIGSTRYTTFAAFRGAMQAFGAANESHSINVNPLFVSPYDNLALQLTSPSYQTGINLSSTGFSTDYANIPRGSLWSMGAYQSDVSTPVTTTTTTPSPTTTLQTTTTLPGATTSTTSPVPTTTTSTSTSTTTLPGPIRGGGIGGGSLS